MNDFIEIETDEEREAKRRVAYVKGLRDFAAFLETTDADFETLTYQVYIMRNQVCERIVTGTKEVPAISYPAHTEEIVEWKCEPWLESPKAD